jgi:hypothetical protein
MRSLLKKPWNSMNSSSNSNNNKSKVVEEKGMHMIGMLKLKERAISREKE